jgi:hypothetical protein
MKAKRKDNNIVLKDWYWIKIQCLVHSQDLQLNTILFADPYQLTIYDLFSAVKYWGWYCNHSQYLIRADFKRGNLLWRRTIQEISPRVRKHN